MFAARLWWMLRWVGHDAVAVLDGGLPAWQAHGLPLSTERASTPRGNVDAQPPRDALSTWPMCCANLANTVAHRHRCARAGPLPRRKRNARSGRRPYPGREKPLLQGQPAGRRPLQAGRSNCVRNSAALIDDAGSQPSCNAARASPPATTCWRWKWPGLTGAALYPGSWSEWCADPARPVEIGN